MQRRGFTLVEILVVVAIIAVLAGILFPVMIAVRRRAEHTTCAENLHQLGLAVTMYANDHDGWVPPATTNAFVCFSAPPSPQSEIDASPGVLRQAMESYVKSETVWFCPANPQARQNAMWLGQRHRLTSYWFYPVTPGETRTWPMKMQIGRDPSPDKPVGSEDVPLFSDAVGLPDRDSDPQFRHDDMRAASNHPDAMANAIRHDLSLTRGSAKEWMGTEN
ncbi:hypothetical protein BH11ARM2_BH11ARM2_00730 [soil metagenome]